MSAPIGVLLSNLGTPDAPTTAAVRRYLREFLSDRRVVDLPRWLWLPILYGFVLPLRPGKSAHAYQQIWTPQGSPLRVICERLVTALQAGLDESTAGAFRIALGMRYGNPSIASALETLRQAGIRRVLVLPLYPQFSTSTTASTRDALARAASAWPDQRQLRFLRHYYDRHEYIQALAVSVQRHWQQQGRGEILIMSFHGTPEKSRHLGDPYYDQCVQTAHLLAAALQLPPKAWRLTLQSRFGPAPWLQPYTDATLVELARSGMRKVDLICPGFSVDCLETLEENGIRNRAAFVAAGGEELRGIPCLNDSSGQVEMLAKMIRRECEGWYESSS